MPGPSKVKLPKRLLARRQWRLFDDELERRVEARPDVPEAQLLEELRAEQSPEAQALLDYDEGGSAKDGMCRIGDEFLALFDAEYEELPDVDAAIKIVANNER